MKQLTIEETMQVSGGGMGAAWFGSALIGAVGIVNNLLNAAGPIGLALNNLGPVVRIAHQAGDSAIYEISKIATGIGRALGGKGSPNYHYPTEW
ncbi:hypothetical protein [Collimonas sp.]|uniref:hypothetical protein n=1 Tax=Collimonas sp. TaxID=1963772 RepID=UPI002BFC8109|nr:hypothetical protein [Collimonas sp.]HWW03945.1 hypothetical protein [Collimonas sp.]